MKSTDHGENGDILLAAPLREKIAEAYRAEDERKPNSLMTDEMDVLVIDMSLIGIQTLINTMPLFRSVTTLVITCSETGVPADLSAILRNAQNYPLKKLYIVNFGEWVTSLPDEATRFENLNTLGIFNNQISVVPASLANCNALKELYIDNNPLTTTFPALDQIKHLEVLGLVNTQVPGSEVSMIKKMYPACKVLTE